MHNVTHLVARENQSVSNHNILTTSRGEHNDFSNVLWCKRFTVSIALVSPACHFNISVRIYV